LSFEIEINDYVMSKFEKVNYLKPWSLSTQVVGVFEFRKIHKIVLATELKNKYLFNTAQ